MKISSKALLFAASLILSVPALAHSNAYLDTLQAPHGGQLRMSGPYHMELVVSTPGELTAYVTDHGDAPQMTAGAEGVAKVKNGKKEISIKLEPVGENMLKGKGEFKVNAKTVVVVFLKMAGKDAEGFEFTPLKPKVKAKGRATQSDSAGHDGHH
ncbi:MAG: hypothetical protein HZB64_09380 [Rhodocyclales bacterium]|nr:hypothetical protein [Rhodocyclales bacterium]